MTTKQLMKGCEAIAEAALRGGCRYFFGYPSPRRMIFLNICPPVCRRSVVFFSRRSRRSQLLIWYTAPQVPGARVMTSSSSPGISLKQEGISTIAGAELPCVIVNVMRGGPGIGGIQGFPG